MPDVFVKQGDTGTRLRGGNIRWIVVVCEAGPPEVSISTWGQVTHVMTTYTISMTSTASNMMQCSRTLARDSGILLAYYRARVFAKPLIASDAIDQNPGDAPNAML